MTEQLALQNEEQAGYPLMRRPGIQADPNLKPLKLRDILDEVAPMGERKLAEDLIGCEFEIVRARPFVSRFPTQDHAWFVVGATVPNGELFNTVLGGSAVVEILDAWSKTGRSEPLVVTLGWVQGGRYGGYYVLE